MFKKIELQKMHFLVYLIIPVLIILSSNYAYRKKERILKYMIRDIAYKNTNKKIVFITIGLILIIISLLQPVILRNERYLTKRGLDIYFLIDISSSMLVEDVSINRLEEGKQLIRNIVEKLDGDRIGLIPFSSQAYHLLPLTDDYTLVNNYLKALSPEMASGGGTNILSAVKLAKSLFERGARGDKVIILISDGEFHDELINIEKTLSGINYDDIYFYSLLTGTEKGSMIPVYDERGNKTDYKKDSSNRVIFSKADKKAMETLAVVTGGQFYYLSKDRLAVYQIINQLKVLKRVERNGKMAREYKELFQYFLIPGFFLFLIGYLIPESVMEDEKESNS